MIRVDNNEVGYFYRWDLDTFQDRLRQMRAILEKYFVDGQYPDYKFDPFWSPQEAVQIGVAFLSLKMLSYVFENEAEVTIVSTDGGDVNRGKITLAYYPCD
jgi:hypothetical protein